MLIFNKRPSPSGLGQNIPNKCGIICVPANGARPEQCLANNISQTVWSMKNKIQLCNIVSFSRLAHLVCVVQFWRGILKINGYEPF